MSFPNRNALWAQVIADELEAAGVHHVAISPGSRSTPLALAFLSHPRLKTSVHHDERSAGFFALGMAKRGRAPVALLCTSGTAAANYFPAVVEASLGGVPLVVLTADRPPEARGWGAPQTIDQVGLYGNFARWAVDLPLPEPTRPMIAFLRQTLSRAVGVATNAPRGPVHLNVPLRDPLPPIEIVGDVPASLAEELGAHRGEPTLTIATSETRILDAELRPFAEKIAHEPRGVIAVGSIDPSTPLATALGRFAEACRWPILAEATSSLRLEGLAPHLIEHAELLARSVAFAGTHAPQLALRLGQTPTTRALAAYLDIARTTLRIDEPGRWIDPTHGVSAILSGDVPATIGRLAELIHELSPSVEPSWSGEFQRANSVAGATLVRALDAEENLGELHAAREIFEALPEAVPLWVASSMPIRDLESVATVRRRLAPVLANRGANGIDGTIASALGAAAAGDGRAALLIGDVAMLHDVNSLLSAKLLGLSLTVVLVNNDGGGIFSFLEVAKSVDRGAFEKLWGTPHGTNFSAAAAAFGASHASATTRSELRTRLQASLAHRAPGAEVIEVRTDREENVAAHRRVFAAVDRALEGQPWRSST